jgi:hypothetical protein
MLTPAVVARDAQRLRVRIDDDDGVNAIFVALPAVIFHGLSGAVWT